MTDRKPVFCPSLLQSSSVVPHQHFNSYFVPTSSIFSVSCCELDDFEDDNCTQRPICTSFQRRYVLPPLEIPRLNTEHVHTLSSLISSSYPSWAFLRRDAWLEVSNLIILKPA